MTKQAINLTNQTRILTNDEFNAQGGNYLFYNQMIKMVSKIEELNLQLSSNDPGLNTKYSVNTIGIIGERGAGKSSVMGTLGNVLKANGYHVFPPIDPSIFDDSLSVLEMFVSLLVEHITANEKKVTNDYAIKAYQSVKKLMKVLAEVRFDSKSLAMKLSHSELMNSVNDRVCFDDLLSKALKDFRVFCAALNETAQGNHGRKAMVILIDDLDIVSNKYAYQMFENITNFLSNHIITVLAYREVQLVHSVMNEKLRDNELLNRHGQVSLEDIREQAINYIQKSIPFNQRFHLHQSHELYQLNLSTVFNGLSVDFIEGCGDKSVKQWISDRIYSATRIDIDPVQDNENTPYNLPNNLRGLIQFIYWINENLKPVTIEVKEKTLFRDYAKEFGEIRKNLVKFSSYLVYYAQSALSDEQSRVISLWEQAEMQTKNHVAYLHTRNLMEKHGVRDDIKQGLLDMRIVKAINVNQGDVHDILEIYKMVGQVKGQICYYAYTFKLLYSIQNLINLIDLLPNDESKIISDSNAYFTLINHQLIDVSVFTGEDIQGRGASKVVPFVHQYSTENVVLFANFAVSGLAASGDILPVARLKENGKIGSSANLTYSNYSVYDLQEMHESYCINNLAFLKSDRSKFFSECSKLGNETVDDFFITNTKYILNPITFLLAKGRIFRTLCTDSFKDTYYYFSMFDLDILKSLNYTRRSENNLLAYAIRKINNVFTRNLKTNREVDLTIRLRRTLFNEQKIEVNLRPLLIDSEVQAMFETDSELEQPPKKSLGTDSELKQRLTKYKEKQNWQGLKYEDIFDDLLQVVGLNETTVNTLKNLYESFETYKNGGPGIVRDELKTALRKIIDEAIEVLA